VHTFTKPAHHVDEALAVAAEVVDADVEPVTRLDGL
jgi:hypothetical protein